MGRAVDLGMSLEVLRKCDAYIDAKISLVDPVIAKAPCRESPPYSLNELVPP